MTTSIEIPAVFENGVLKPLTPLNDTLTEGQQVQIIVQIATTPDSYVSQPTLEELTPERVKELIKSAKIYNSVKEYLDSPEAKEPRQAPLAGSAKDKVLYMAEDFDEPLEDFEEYM